MNKFKKEDATPIESLEGYTAVRATYEAPKHSKQEKRMFTDIDYAIEVLGISEDMTIQELIASAKKLHSYGWDIGVCELIDIL